MNYETELKQFLDKEGKLKQWPSNHDKRSIALEFIGQRFDTDKNYKESEVNDIIKSAISFGDHQTVRRELVSAGVLDRTSDGTKYWKVLPGEKPVNEYSVPK